MPVYTKLGDVQSVWTYGVFFIVLLCLLMLVRNISYFSFTFILGNITIFLSLISICAYSIYKLSTDGLGEGIVLFNTKHTNKIWSTIGYTIYIFEGIGLVMPIMQACDSPHKFDSIFAKSVVTIFLFMISNGIINYLAFGY